jgi:hypothetical protein
MQGLRIALIAAIWFGSVGSVLAEPADPAVARTRWNEGARALASGDLEGARLAFQAAYDVLPNLELAQSLGEVEYRTRHFADAVRHLTMALDSRKLSREERKLSKKSLQKALAQVGMLVVQVNVEGADVLIDNELIGRSPLGQSPWYIDFGAHQVTVHKDAYADLTQKAELAPGETVRLSFTLSPLPQEPRDAIREAPATATPEPARSESTAPDQTAVASLPIESTSTGRTITLLTGVTLTTISLALGTYFSLLHGPDEEHARELSQQAAVTVGTKACAPENGAARPALCEELAGAYDTIDAHRNVALMSFATAAVLGAATAATFVLWRRPNSTALVLSPHPRGIGIIASGNF